MATPGAHPRSPGSRAGQVWNSQWVQRWTVPDPCPAMRKNWVKNNGKSLLQCLRRIWKKKSLFNTCFAFAASYQRVWPKKMSDINIYNHNAFSTLSLHMFADGALKEWHQLGQHNWALNTSGKWDVLFSVAPAGSSGFSQIGMPSGSLNDNSKRGSANLRHCYRLLQHKQVFRSPKMIKWTGDIYVDIQYSKSRHHMIVAWLVHLDPGVWTMTIQSFTGSGRAVAVSGFTLFILGSVMGWWDDGTILAITVNPSKLQLSSLESADSMEICLAFL